MPLIPHSGYPICHARKCLPQPSPPCLGIASQSRGAAPTLADPFHSESFLFYQSAVN